jgi:hypothetical protein
MPHIWNGPIGPVTITSNREAAWRFSSISAAAHFIRRHRIHMTDRPVVKIGSGFIGLDAPYGRSATMTDELGLVVPLWRIMREMDVLPPTEKPSWLRRGPADYDPERDFRKGALPGSGLSRRYVRYLRRVRTIAELRAHDGFLAEMRHDARHPADLEDDEEITAPQIKVRARRKNLPTLWDDIPHARRGESWKHYRKTRYKGG